jgi:hypothetical protein
VLNFFLCVYIKTIIKIFSSLCQRVDDFIEECRSDDWYLLFWSLLLIKISLDLFWPSYLLLTENFEKSVEYKYFTVTDVAFLVWCFFLGQQNICVFFAFLVKTLWVNLRRKNVVYLLVVKDLWLMKWYVILHWKNNIPF